MTFRYYMHTIYTDHMIYIQHMYIYIYVYIYIYICLYLHTKIYTHKHIYMYIHPCVYNICTDKRIRCLDYTVPACKVSSNFRSSSVKDRTVAALPIRLLYLGKIAAEWESFLHAISIDAIWEAVQWHGRERICSPWANKIGSGNVLLW